MRGSPCYSENPYRTDGRHLRDRGNSSLSTPPQVVQAHTVAVTHAPALERPRLVRVRRLENPHSNPHVRAQFTFS
jgi:hypothetical protein